MQNGTVKKRNQSWFRRISLLLTLTLIVTMCPPLQWAAYGAAGNRTASWTMEQPEILVSGSAVIGASEYTADNIGLEKSYTREELKAMDGAENAVYSAINTYKTIKFYKASGVYLESLLKGTAFDASKDKLQLLSSDDRRVSFDPTVAYVNGNSDTTGFGEKRYYFPNVKTESEAEKQEVKTLLSWANGNGSSVPESAGTEKDSCTVITGQLSAADQNNPLYNKNMERVIGGEALDETALTVDDRTYTRGDVLLMKRAEKSYTYSSSGGSREDYVRGVPMSVLLEGADENSIVTFGTADNYPVDASGKTVKELIDGNYMLAYEKGSGADTLEGIYSNAKNDVSVKGFFTLYGDGVKPAKMVNNITITASGGIDFKTSPYKHITNGGQSGSSPYNIDAITGATLTAEGPGLKNSVPVSVKDLEGQNKGAFRGNYKDVRDGQEAEFTYEGIDLYYILHNMASGDSGIILTDKAQKVQIKNRNRKTIAEFTLKQIQDLHEKGKPVLVAYGTSDTGGSDIRPFVFDGAAGASEALGNADGCLKLVYDKEAITGDTNNDYTRFGNMAYIYVAEESSPGYKHDKEPYDTAENSQYVLTVTGKDIGREINYTVQQLEEMVKYDGQGKPEEGGIGYRDEYSLANSNYWYVNEYEGVKLWDLLLKSGLSADKATDNNTKVTFSARDGYTAFDKFTLKQIADPNSFGYYEKNAEDNNDGTYRPKDTDLKKTGYPVLVAYGVNGYPYVIKNTLPGYLSGLQNDGGPLRIISGKTEYGHANGSNQAKLLDKVLVGEDTYHYSTHKYHSNEIYQKQAEQKLQVKVCNGSDDDAPVLKNVEYKIGDIEELIYGDKLTSAERSEAKVKEFYEVLKSGKSYSDLYEGMNLNYFLEKVVEIPGQKGTITFGNGTDSVTMDLEEVLRLKNGYNSSSGISGLSPILAYAKNGAPMVASKEAADGYEGTVTLTNGQEITVKNNGGPLCILFPNTSESAKDAKSVDGITSITINLSADHYAHVKAPYDTYQSNTLKVSGEGTRIAGEKEFTLAELEGKQALAVTGDYSILKSETSQASQLRYRGISLYDFLKSSSVGLKTNADKVIATCRDGKQTEFALSDVKKATYINSITGQDNLKMILAYGSAPVTKTDKEDGLPLVTNTTSDGYQEEYQNSGGPIKLVTGQRSAADVNKDRVLKDVVSIEVTASEMTSWNHSSGEVFKEYLSDTFSLQVVDESGKSVLDKKYTIEEMEAMTKLIERAEITGTGVNTWEGLNLWNFVLQETAGISGMDDPITVTAFAKDGFSKELVGIFGMDKLKNGIPDGENRVPILLAYGMDGYPLASGGKNGSPGEGYDSLIGNDGGPIRLMTHGNQGACLQETNKIVIKVKSSTAPQEKVEFQVYAADGKALPMAGIRSIDFDQDGGMWVGTYGGGAAYKAKGSDSFKIYNEESNPKLETGFVSAVATDRDGGVWLSQNASYTEPSNNRGVLYLKDGALTSFKASDSPETIPDDYVQDIKIDHDGCVWFASFGGLTKYDPQKNTWKTWDKQDGFPAMSVDRIELDDNGGVWCGFYPDGGTGKEDPYTGGFAYLDKNGTITAYPQTATFDEAAGLSRLADVWVRDIVVDKNGGAWITASGAYASLENTGGTLWYVPSPGAEAVKYTGDQLFREALDGAANAEIRMVEADSKGGLWFGTSADGIFYVEDPTLTKDHAFSITAEYSKETGSWGDKLLNNIYSLDVKGSMIYAGSSGGLAVVDYLAADGKENAGNVSAGEAEFTIRGDGVIKNAFFNIKGLTNDDRIEQQQKTYFWKNSSGTTGKTAVEGAYLIDILKNITGLTEMAGTVTFIASDGYEKTLDLEDLERKDISGLKPMLAWKEDGQKVNPKLVIGQKTADDVNKSSWLKDLTTVVVNEMSESQYAGKILAHKATLKAAATNYNTVKLSWNKITGVGGYILERAETKNGAYKKIADLKKDTAITYTDKNLKTGTSYYYRVTAYKTTSQGNIKGQCSAAACAKPILGGVKTAKAASQGTYSVKVKWSKVSGAGGYVVYKAQSKNGSYKKCASVKGGSCIVKKLKPGKKYYFKVKAYRTVGSKKVYGAYSKKVTTVPCPGTPALKLKAGKTTIKASWKQVKSVDGYVIYRAKGKQGKYRMIRNAGKSSKTYTSHKLSRKTTYYYKIRSYKKVGGKRVYSKWKTAKVRTK